jgi:hypothetical protein
VIVGSGLVSPLNLAEGPDTGIRINKNSDFNKNSPIGGKYAWNDLQGTEKSPRELVYSPLRWLPQR